MTDLCGRHTDKKNPHNNISVLWGFVYWGILWLVIHFVEQSLAV